MQAQYDFDAEVETEKQNFLKGLHPNMKEWYNSAQAVPFCGKYGTFPAFWQDLSAWKHYTIAKKVYFIVSEKSKGSLYDVMEIDQQVTEMLNYSVSISDQSDSTPVSSSSGAGVSMNTTDATIPRRKARWGSSANVSALTSNDSSNSAFVSVSNDSASDPSTSTIPLSNRWGPPAVIERNRWGPPADADEATNSGVASLDKNRKRSRFSTVSVQSAPAITLTAEQVQQSLVLQMQIQALHERLLGLSREAFLHEQLPPNERPSSPAPIYDSNGKKINTFEVRMREQLTNQRIQMIGEMIKLNPFLPPPADYIKPKPVRRLPIPIDEYPDYNFIGLIIGPRGNTQKRLEQQTMTRISIRGKGAAGRGKSNANVLTSSRQAAQQQDENEPLHVHISGETDDAVDACAAIIAEILVPCNDDSRNELKQKQLKELALISGTLTMEDFCDVCGLRGHRAYECPDRSKTFKAANVKCSICGDMSHPTRDCPMKENPNPTSEVAMDSEYLNFMAELEGKPVNKANSSGVTGAGVNDGTSTSSTAGASATRTANGATIVPCTLFTAPPPPPAGSYVPGSAPTIIKSSMLLGTLTNTVNSTITSTTPAAAYSATASTTTAAYCMPVASNGYTAYPPVSAAAPAYPGYPAAAGYPPAPVAPVYNSYAATAVNNGYGYNYGYPSYPSYPSVPGTAPSHGYTYPPSAPGTNPLQPHQPGNPYANPYPYPYTYPPANTYPPNPPPQ